MEDGIAEEDDDYSWSDEKDDEKVDNLVKLVDAGNSWKADLFVGETIPSAVEVERKENVETKQVKTKKAKQRSLRR